MIENNSKYTFPTSSPEIAHEEWKYTNINPILSKQYNLISENYDDIDINFILEHRKTSSDNLLIFINGKFSEKFSRIVEQDKFELIDKLQDNINNPKVKKYLNSTLTINDTFIQSNKNLSNDGFVFILKDSEELTSPLEIIYFNHNLEFNYLTNSRNLFLIGNNAKLEVIESFIGYNGAEYFNNIVEEFILSENSKVIRYKIINEAENSFHIGRTFISQSKNSLIKDYSISLYGSIIRNDLVSQLNESGAECELLGLYISSNQQLIDNHTEIKHLSANCSSNQLYKGILTDSSKSVFNGKVYVQQDAQKTNAYQSNKNLLLSAEANIYTKPQLEIFADDVKCSHGATVGQLDDDMLFYLQSRGISKESAYKMLIKAFANYVIDLIENKEIKRNIETLVMNKMKNFTL